MQTVVPHIISKIYKALPPTKIRFGVINAWLALLSKFHLIYCDFHDVICGFPWNVLAVMSYKNPNGIHYTTWHESIPPMFLDFNDALVDSLHSHLDFFTIIDQFTITYTRKSCWGFPRRNDLTTIWNEMRDKLLTCACNNRLFAE